MMVDVQNIPVFYPNGQDYGKLRMSQTGGSNWFENADFSAFLNTPNPMEFPHSVPSSSPIETDLNYYATSSPETFNSDASPYTSDVSSPFDPNLFGVESPQHDVAGSPIADVDPTLFDACNLTNPLLLPEIEKILAATPYHQPSSPSMDPMGSQDSPKKRQRDIDFNGDVTLSRDQLLAMSSKEIEEYVSALKTKRTLTPSEEKDLKKQRRLVKNREYASQSRNRKKQYMDDIEKQLDVARAETEGYKRQNQLLTEENRVLKKQLANIAEAIKKSQHGGLRTSGVMQQQHPQQVQVQHQQQQQIQQQIQQQQHMQHSPPQHMQHSPPQHSPQLSPQLSPQHNPQYQHQQHVVNGPSSSSGPVGMFANFATIGGGRHTKTVGAGACLLAIFFMVFTFATFWDNHEPLGMTLFPNQNDGHKFSNRRLLELEEMDAAFPHPSGFPSPHDHHKAREPPLPSSPSQSPSYAAAPSFAHAACYPHVYDATTNSSSWCSTLVHAS